METRNFKNGLIFDLPLIAHLDCSKKNWLLDPSSWITDNLFKKTFQDARDGQGFSGIVYIEKNPFTQKHFAKITIDPAFNGEDGLAKENKYGEPYLITEYVDSNQSSPGMVHKTSIKKNILHTLFSNANSLLSKRLNKTLEQKHQLFFMKPLEEQKKIRKETIIEYFPKLLNSGMLQESIEKLKGMTFGFSITKGAESKDQNDYEIIYINDTQKINYLYDLFRRHRNESLEEYAKDKKYLLLIETTIPNTYDIFYIQNQKIVRRPNYYESDAKPSQINLENNDNKEIIIEKCLKSLNLYHLLNINNKSASQNNLSISYDFNFESYIMYLDRKKYLGEDALIPEGNEWGSLYDLKRSIPISLMFSAANRIYSTLETKIVDDIKIQQKKWNSWDSPEYFENVLLDYLNASTQKKMEIFENNIHITVRLYENTLKTFLEHHCSLEPMTEHPSFKSNFTNYGGYVSYLMELDKRMDHLIMSYYFVANELKENPNELIHGTKYIPNWFKNDNRNIETVLTNCINISSEIDLKGFAVLNSNDCTRNIIAKIKNLDNLHNYFLEEANECIKKMYSATNENEIIGQFTANQKNFLYYMRHAYVDKATIDKEIKILLQKSDRLTHKSLLENVIERGWDSATELLKGYGVEEIEVHCKKRKMNQSR